MSWAIVADPYANSSPTPSTQCLGVCWGALWSYLQQCIPNNINSKQKENSRVDPAGPKSRERQDHWYLKNWASVFFMLFLLGLILKSTNKNNLLLPNYSVLILILSHSFSFSLHVTPEIPVILTPSALRTCLIHPDNSLLLEAWVSFGYHTLGIIPQRSPWGYCEW